MTDRTNAAHKTELDPAAVAYLNELAAEIAAAGAVPTDVFDAMQVAHERRRAFAIEMMEGKTDRAKQARRILCAYVYGRLVMRGAIDTALTALEHQVREAWRQRLLAG